MPISPTSRPRRLRATLPALLAYELGIGHTDLRFVQLADQTERALAIR